MNKAIFNLLAASLLLIFLVGCGGGGDSSAVTNTNSTTPNLPQQSNSNHAPIADAGGDQTVNVGNIVILDGSDSYDPDENYPLAYEWQIISKPSKSTADLSISGSSEPIFTFTVDLSGEYTIQLVVRDNLGKVSEPAIAVVSTSNSMPVADAGPDQSFANAGITIEVDGSQSFDPDGDPITYSWSITSKPPSSSAALDDPAAINPTFVADSLGTYVIELIVTDDMGLESFPDKVEVSSENVKPVADAGVNRVVLVGKKVFLDGTGSYDENLDLLTYRWNIVFKPKNSLAELDNSDTEDPDFEPDIQGLYTLNLVVNDGLIDSDPSDVLILAIDAVNLDAFISALMDAAQAISELDAKAFNNENNRNVLTSKIIAVIKNYLQDDYGEELLNTLRDDIGGKMEGCFMPPFTPDQSDWIMNCSAQQYVYQDIELAISILEDILNTP